MLTYLANVGWQCSQRRGTNQDKPLKCKEMFLFELKQDFRRDSESKAGHNASITPIWSCCQTERFIFKDSHSPGMRNINRRCRQNSLIGAAGASYFSLQVALCTLIGAHLDGKFSVALFLAFLTLWCRGQIQVFDLFHRINAMMFDGVSKTGRLYSSLSCR